MTAGIEQTLIVAGDVVNVPVEFTPVTTRCLRAVFDASTNDTTYAAVALQEWEAYSARPRAARRPSVKGAASPDCS